MLICSFNIIGILIVFYSVSTEDFNYGATLIVMCVLCCITFILVQGSNPGYIDASNTSILPIIDNIKIEEEEEEGQSLLRNNENKQYYLYTYFTI